jgi:hypothetical protein
MRTKQFFWGLSFTLHAALLTPLAIAAAFTPRPGIPEFAPDFRPADPAPIESQQLDSIEPAPDEPTPPCCGPIDPEAQPPEPSANYAAGRPEEPDPALSAQFSWSADVHACAALNGPLAVHCQWM